MFEGGEEALHHGVVPAAALGQHAAGDLSAFQQLPVGHRPVLAPLIGVNQELIRFDLAVPQSPVEGLQHQRGFHGHRFQERCHPCDQSTRGLEGMTNASLQRGRQS